MIDYNDVIFSYDFILDIDKFEAIYHRIKVNTKHKEKLFRFEVFKNCNFITLYDDLKNRTYHHNKYNIFIISEPKYRVIMSEGMTDKIVNHLVSHYILFPLLEPKLIDMNVATRPNKGTKMALFYIKKYINHMKFKYDKVYVLKCDISKFFYSLNHEVLIDKLSKLITDVDLLNLIKEIINSTDYDYINKKIDKYVSREKEKVIYLKISNKEKMDKLKELENIPRYEKGKGLPIGNMTSQILAIFYLNDLDHYIKEQLHIKGYVRYMDDFILFHHDKEYLKYCLGEIEKQLDKVKLTLNKKTQIYDVSHGFPFLGYRIILKDKRLHVLMNKKSKKRIKRRINHSLKTGGTASDILDRYNGYLLEVESGNFIYQNKLKDKETKEKEHL